MEVLTWTCHACGDERPDDKIAVFSRVRSIEDAGGATFSENIRYCADRSSCADRAQRISFLKGEGEDPAPPPDLPRRPRSLAERIKARWFGG